VSGRFCKKVTPEVTVCRYDDERKLDPQQWAWSYCREDGRYVEKMKTCNSLEL